MRWPFQNVTIGVLSGIFIEIKERIAAPLLLLGCEKARRGAGLWLDAIRDYEDRKAAGYSPPHCIAPLSARFGALYDYLGC
jgi:hypothetical protein